MAGTVLLRVPRSLCQRILGHRLALGEMVLSRARRLVLRSSGRVRTCFTVSIANPRTTFCVLQAALPLRSFLREIGSSRAMLSLLLRRKSLLMARKRCHIICLLSVGPPCVIPMKPSKYTSTCARAVARACGDRASQFLSASSVSVASSYEVCGGLVSAKSSRWRGGAVWRVARVSSDLS